MSCGDCFQTEKEQQKALVNVTAKAKDFATENKKLVVIYKTDSGTFSYMEAEAARSAGVVPIQFVSEYQHATNDRIY